MAGIYPSLHEKFKNEGICPICMMSMSQTPKYSCDNGHTICHRCKPYYYACPTCNSSLNIQIPPAEVEGYHMPPAMHYMPHPYPPVYPPGNEPSAPFIDQEKYTWAPPIPSEDQELKHCGFCHAGCEARFPEHLRNIHESRCQFRPNLEDEKLPTDLSYDEEILQECRYRIVGCNVRLPEWRKKVHEDICIYKDKYEALDGIRDNLDNDEELKHCGFSYAGCTARFLEHLREIHESQCEYRPNSDEDQQQQHDDSSDEGDIEICRYHVAGCNVRLPEWRRIEHEKICIYKDKYEAIDEIRHGFDDLSFGDDCGDPEGLVDCPFRQYGCAVRMPRRRRATHQQKCNYRDYHTQNDECVYEPEIDPDQPVACPWAEHGCQVMPRYCRRNTHAEKCNYRMENCSYKDYGCDATFQPARRFLHERSCEYAP